MAKKLTTAYSKKMRTRASIHSAINVVSRLGSGASGAFAIANFLVGDVPGGVAGLAGAAALQGMASSAAELRTRNKAKAYAAERGAMKRAKLNAAPVTAQGKQQKAARVATGFVKGHFATSSAGKQYWVKQHIRRV